jgi:hypothetical protein
MVCVAAGFNADQEWLQVGEVGVHLGTFQLLAHCDFAALIHAVYLENILCQINTNCRNLHFLKLLSLVSGLQATTTLAL